MDLASKRMYDTFKNEIWKDMGPLDTKWFEALTAEAFAGTVSDQDELCANQEGNFKTPTGKSVDSQKFSIPKVFRHSQTLSPEADNEQSFTAKESETLLWTAESPCQMTKERMQTAKSYAVPHSSYSSDLLCTPNKSKINYAKHISESLSTEVSDISWTSSLNTPPPVPSTLILSRKDESSNTATLSVDKNVFVRKLFPSVSNASRNASLLLKNNVSINQEDGIHTEDNADMNESFQTLLNPSWRPTLPDATEDVEVCSTVASVLHEAENALSIFFTNSSSVSRKVKNERVKRKQIILVKRNGCDAVEVSPANNAVLSEDEVKEPDSASVQPIGNFGITPCSPLSLSEIQETSCCDKVQVENSLLTEQSFRKTNSGQLTTHLKNCGVTKKKQCFNYTVQSLKPQAKEMNCQTKTLPPSICLIQQIYNSNNCKVLEGDHVQNVENVTGVEALDILQPFTALPKHFSQMSCHVECSPVTEDALCHGVSPSACLLALKRAKQKAKLERIYSDCEDISDRELASALNLNTMLSKNHHSDLTRKGVVDTDQNVINTLEGTNFNTSFSQNGFKMASEKVTRISTKAVAGNICNDIKRTEFKNSQNSRCYQNEDANRVENIPVRCDTATLGSTCFPFSDSVDTSQIAKPKKIAKRHNNWTNSILLTSQNGGFKKANDKGLTISSAALKKSKLIMGEYDQVENNVKPPNSKPQTPLHTTKGFVAASGKEVAISIKALQKSKSLLDEICSTVDTPVISSKRKNTENKVTIKSGFTAVGQEKVNFSQPQLQRGSNEDVVHGAYLLAQGGIETRGEPNILNGNPVSKVNARLMECQASLPTRSNEFHTDNIKRTKLPVNICEKPIILGATSGNSTVSETWKTGETEMKNVEITQCSFRTTGGTKVHRGKKNFEKLKHLWKDFDDTCLNDTKEFHLTKGDTKGTIPFSAFKKSKWLLNDTEDSKDKSIWTQSHSKLAINDLALRTCGFQSASGKAVAVSAEALKKAMALFDNMSFIAENLSVSEARETAENTGTIQCDFTTAGGTKVHIAKKNIKKVKSLWKDFEKDEQLRETSTSNLVSSNGNGLSVSDKAMRKAKLLSEDQISKCDTHLQAIKKQISLPPQKKGFQTAGDRAISISSAALIKAKRLFHEYEDTEDQIPNALGNDAPPRTSGFQSATGKPVAVSAKALKKTQALTDKFSSTVETLAFSDTRETEENTESIKCLTTAWGTENHLERKITEKVHKNLCKDFEKDSYLEHSNDSGTNLTKDNHLNETSALNFISTSGKSFHSENGFITASGKTVNVSDEAVSEAKELLSEDQKDTNLQFKPNLNFLPPQSNGFETTGCHRLTFSSVALKKNPKQLLCENAVVAVNEPSSVTSGFQVASGKPVAISSKALQKAMALFDDSILTADILAGSETRETRNTKTNAATIQHSFALPRADVAKKNVKVDHFTLNLNPPVKKDMPIEEVNHNLTKMTVPMEFHKEKNMFSEFNHNESTEEKKSIVGTKHCSILSLESPHLSGCTATQQRLLAQEAMYCTMALLEDEVQTAQSLTVGLENIPLQSNPKPSFISVKPQNRMGKRQAEDENTTDQSSPKRRLLEEFDRMIDGPNGSTVYPVKSCPSDRRVFQYSMSLHPNITRPHGSGKLDIESKQKGSAPSTPANGQTANTRTSVFVPPFLHNTRTQTQKNGTQKDNKETTSAFVPPFKNHKTDVQESSTTAQEDDSGTSSKPNPFVLPTRKKTNSMDVSNRKSKHNTQTETLPPHTSENPVKTQNPTAAVTDETATGRSQKKDIAHCQETIENLENIQLARNMQDMRIWKKKNIHPLPGCLFLTKTSQVARISFRTAVNEETPQKYTQKQLYEYGVHQHLSDFSSETAKYFRFNLLNFHKQEVFTEGSGVQLADGGWLIPRNDGTAGKEEFFKALCDTPGVNPKLLSEEWVYNHYQWVVWKLMSMEKSFPATMGSLCLTPEQVLLQLKYRYDIEVDQSHRPALRKIMEKDDTAAKTLVLCMCWIISNGRLIPRTPQDVSANSKNLCAVVMLTDGWYAIKAQLDEPLTAMLHKGRIAVGVKLIIHGAQLVGSQDACSPLEAPESLMLKIYANSTRRVHWDTKLGFRRDPRPFLLPVSSLFCNGGPVGCVDIVVLRSYPIQWMERKPDGRVVFRTARAEEKDARRYDCQKQKTMETLYAKIEAEFENEEKGKMKYRHGKWTMRPEDLARLQDGEELYEAMGDDLAHVEAQFSEEQLETLGAYRRTLMDQRQAELQDRYRQALEDAETNEGSCPKRDVTTVWRLCVADSLDQTGSSGLFYQLSIWKPSSDLQALLKEGCRYKIYNLTASKGKKQGGSTTVQLVSTKKTQFQDLQASQEWLSAHFQPRVCVSFVELKNPAFKALCGEVDLTGFVIRVIDEHSFSPAFYLVDMSLNFVKVRSFVSFSQSGWEDIVKLRVLLALSNLQLRDQSLSPTPVLYAGDMTVLSTNPREVHLQQSLCQLRDALELRDDFFLKAEKRLSEIFTSDGQNAIVSPAVSSTSQSTKDTRHTAKTNVTCQLPVRSLGAYTPVTRTPSLLTTSTEKEAKSLKRRRALDYLSGIPSPPPLSQLSTSASPCVKKTFKPPRCTKTLSSLKAGQTPAPKPVPVEEGWVNDEELAMINTQELRAADSLLD